MTKTKLVLGLIVLAAVGLFVWQVESYFKANDAWKVQSVQATNNNTTNIMTIGSYLSAQIAREASSTKK